MVFGLDLSLGMMTTLRPACATVARVPQTTICRLRCNRTVRPVTAPRRAARSDRWHMPTHGHGDITTPRGHRLWRVTVRHGGAGYHRQSGDELAPRPDIVMHRHDISTVGGPPRHANAARLTPGETRSDMTPKREESPIWRKLGLLTTPEPPGSLSFSTTVTCPVAARAHHENRGLRHGGANSSLPEDPASTRKARRFFRNLRRNPARAVVFANLAKTATPHGAPQGSACCAPLLRIGHEDFLAKVFPHAPTRRFCHPGIQASRRAA